MSVSATDPTSEENKYGLGAASSSPPLSFGDTSVWGDIIRKSRSGLLLGISIELYRVAKTAPQNPLTNLLDRIGEGLTNPDLLDPAPLLDHERSRAYRTEGVVTPNLHIGFINGIRTSYAEALEYASHISHFASGHSINGVYSQEHSLPLSALEIALSVLGYSPNTAKLLQEDWIKFHMEHIDNPKAKILQFCHSQGAFHTKNALNSCPKEIRDRVIVVAIAPTTIIPEESCFRSYNYASKNDIAHWVELVGHSAYNTRLLSGELQKILEHRKELILLNPHPGAKGFDHNFNSPTYVQPIQAIVDDYFMRNGEYDV